MTRHMEGANVFDSEVFPRVLKAARVARGLSQAQASEQARVSSATFSYAERVGDARNKAPDIETFGRLCVWMRIDPGCFFKTPPPPEQTEDQPPENGELPSY